MYELYLYHLITIPIWSHHHINEVSSMRRDHTTRYVHHKVPSTTKGANFLGVSFRSVG